MTRVIVMEVKHYKSEVLDPRRKINPVDVIIENCIHFNHVLRYLSQLKPNRVNDYTVALGKRLQHDIKDFRIDYSELDIEEVLIECDYLKRYPELRELMILFVFNELKLPDDYQPKSEEIEVSLLNWLRSSNVFRYHRVKAIVDIMDRAEGIELWKDMVYRATQDLLRLSNDECHPPIKEITNGWVKEGETGESNLELTVVSYDDHKLALRFDRCPVFDSIKHLEDREVAYLSYCWTGTPEQELNKKARRKNTPQTLYQSNYCIEFYWNNEVHPDAQPPSSEFWEKIANTEKSD